MRTSISTVHRRGVVQLEERSQDALPGQVARRRAGRLTRAREHGEPALGRDPAELRGQPRLADAGLSRDQEHAPGTRRRFADGRSAELELELPRDHRELVRSLALRPSRRWRATQCRDGDRLRLPLHPDRRPTVEQRLHHGARGRTGRHECFAWPRSLHQPGGEVDRVANSGVLLPRRGAHGAAEGEPRGDADAHRAARQIQQLPSEGECPLLVVLVQDGSAEEDDEEAPFVTHFDLPKVAAVAADELHDAREVRLQLGRRFRVAVVVGAFETDEQHGQPAVLVDKAFEAPMKALHDNGVEKRRQRRERLRRHGRRRPGSRAPRLAFECGHSSHGALAPRGDHAFAALQDPFVRHHIAALGEPFSPCAEVDRASRYDVLEPLGRVPHGCAQHLPERDPDLGSELEPAGHRLD